jgi:pyruvate dehydrogenase E2 component (dihydrolipoamide acetyltransferase)
VAAATELSPEEVVGVGDAPAPLVPVITPDTGDGAASPAPPHPETSADSEPAVDFYLRATIEAAPLHTVVDEINQGSTAPVSVRHLMIKAVAAAHRRVPELGKSWAHERVGAGSAADVAVDLETEDGPVRGVLTDVTLVTISTLAERICALATAVGEADTVASTGLLVVTDRLDSADEYGHASRHAAFLSIGARDDRRGTDRDAVVTVALSRAHCRSGQVAARWMAAFLEELEHPVRLLA